MLQSWGMARPVRGLALDSDQRKELESLVRAPTTPQRSVQRARILLACADGLSQQEAARRVGVRRRIVTKWCGRFRKLGLAGLTDAGGRGRKPSLSEESRALILTQATRPPKGKTRHSVRSMARTADVSVGTVHALWQANDIKPHLTRTFKLSNDPQFEAKFWDVIGLELRTQFDNVCLEFFQIRCRVRDCKQFLQTLILCVQFHLLRESFFKAPFNIRIGRLRIVGWATQIRRQEQGNEYEHTAHRSNYIRESEEGNFRIKSAKAISHGFVSAVIALGCCSRLVRRSLETIFEWQ
jgi:transposase